MLMWGIGRGKGRGKERIGYVGEEGCGDLIRSGRVGIGVGIGRRRNVRCGVEV